MKIIFVWLLNKMKLYNDAMYDILMFMLGIMLGSAVDYSFVQMIKLFDHKVHVGVVGLLQVFVISVILQTIKLMSNNNLGLFSLGFLVNQTLFIKRLFDYKTQVLKEKEQDNKQ
jgi:hypothetical protein